MKKSTILAITSMVLFGFAANAFAADLWGYPVVEKQLRFYSIIFGIIGISVLLVAASCLFSRLFEVKRAAKSSDREVFGRFVAAAHTAK